MAIGKTYLETKRRPRFIISQRTWEPLKRQWLEDEKPIDERTPEQL